MNSANTFLDLKRSFGNQDYQIADPYYRERIMNHALFQSIWTAGPSFTLVANTKTWKIETIAGDCEKLTGFSGEEILRLQEKFVLNFAIEEHVPTNMLTVKFAMDYLVTRPVHEREKIFVIYFYQAKDRNGNILTLQHQSLPLLFDENQIPFIFCNIYSDISYLQPVNIPFGLIINRHINETFQVLPHQSELTKFIDLFSEREMEIVRFLINGMTSNQIAEIIYISPETVKTHRKNILRKAGLSKTSQLVRYCLSNGFI